MDTLTLKDLELCWKLRYAVEKAGFTESAEKWCLGKLDQLLSLARRQLEHPLGSPEGLRPPASACAPPALADAARALVERMDLIHDDPQYQGVWVLYQNHNGYYQGPTYEHELKALKEALKPRAVESDSQIPQKPTESGLRECMACGLKTDTKTCLDAFCGANTRPVFSTPATDQSTNGKAMSEEGGAA